MMNFYEIKFYFYLTYLFLVILAHKEIGLFWQQGQRLFFDLSPHKRVEGLLEGMLIFADEKRIDFVPQYKFYSRLFYRIAESTRSYGLRPHAHLALLKKNILRDVRFENKLREELLGGQFQCFIVAGVTWALWLTMRKLQLGPPQVTSSIHWPLLLFLGHACGFIFLQTVTTFLKQSLFRPFESYLSSLLSLQILHELSLSLKVMIDESKILTIMGQHSCFRFLDHRLTQIIHHHQEFGSDIRSDLASCVEELWGQKELKQTVFLKWLTLWRLLTIIIFFLGPYFLFMFSFFSAQFADL